MAHYSNTNLPQLLAVGDTVNFTVRDKLFKYCVETHYLENLGIASNRIIAIELGITDNRGNVESDQKLYKFFKAVTGKTARTGIWPDHSDMAAQTKFVLALFSIINGAKIEDFMPKAKPKKTIRQSRQEHADIEAALKAGNWGCQKASVYKLISAITGFEFEP